MVKNVKLSEVVEFLDEFCGVSKMRDFPPAHNGLQFENSGNITRIAAAVDAGGSEIGIAAHLGANLLIVHHGLFWNPPEPVVGGVYEKVKTLIDGDIAVYSVHLPLDAHDTIGNNVLIARALGLKIVDRCFECEGAKIGVVAEAPKGGRAELASKLAGLFRTPARKSRSARRTPKESRFVRAVAATPFRICPKSESTPSFAASFASGILQWLRKCASTSTPAGTTQPSVSARRLSASLWRKSSG